MSVNKYKAHPDADTAPVHDDIVRFAAEQRRALVKAAFECGVLPSNPLCLSDTEDGQEDSPEIECELEYEMAGGKAFVDLAFFRRQTFNHRGSVISANERELILLAEIKSAREDQSASSWFRQVRGYSQLAGVPCVLVVAHKLGNTQLEYLKFAGVSVLVCKGEK